MEATLSNYLAYSIGGNSVRDYALTVGVTLVVLIVLMIIKSTTQTRLNHTVFAPLMKKFRWPVFLLISLYLGLQFILAPPQVEILFSYLLFAVATYYLVHSLTFGVDIAMRHLVAKHLKEDKNFDSSVLHLLHRMINVALWIIGVIVVLQNVGYNISALVAGLGVGGVAVAFALQNILIDIFASLSIYFDKPFQVGDFITVGNDTGVVKKIGMKSTRIQTLQGQELIVSNKELTETRVNNFKRMERRRISFKFTVNKTTTADQLKKIPPHIKAIIEKLPLADFDRCHFFEFAASGLIFEVVYYINSSHYSDYMDIQQAINLGIKEVSEKEGVTLA